MLSIERRPGYQFYAEVRLENKEDDHYAKHCLQISKEMAEKNQMSLMKKVNTLCNNSNLNDYLNIITKKHRINSDLATIAY